jgi:hypothetical protein
MIVLKKILTSFLVLLILVFSSCQNQTAEEKYTTITTIIKTTPLTTYVERIAMQKTTQDNMIDKSSYCTIKLPYVVKVNSVTIPVNATGDYQKVLDNINASTSDDDIVKITFPVTMVYYNYVEKKLDKQSDFDDLIAYWNASPDLLSKINCLNINYPIVINSYNSDNQLGNSATFNDDKSLFNFLDNLKNDQYIAISYPISIKNTDTNQTTTIANNDQFENAINFALSNCKENNPPGSLDFVKAITGCSWEICYSYHDFDRTSNFKGYSFVFKADNTVVATKNGVDQNGIWSTKINSNGYREFKVKFNSIPLKELDDDWNVFEFNASKLRFSNKDGNYETNYLYFDKI